jgi:hypothetical protein
MNLLGYAFASALAVLVIFAIYQLILARSAGEGTTSGTLMALGGCVAMLAFLTGILIPSIGEMKLFGLPIWADGLIGMAIVTTVYMTGGAK